MGFYIQDDFWEASSVLTEKQQLVFLGALTKLFYTGQDTNFDSPVADALFVAFKQRVLIARKRSDAGKSKPESKQQSNEASKHESKDASNANQNEHQNSEQNGHQNEIKPKKSERESESKGKSGSEKVKNTGRFAPPTPDEVAAYAIEKNLALDAQRFVDYYAAQGWKLSNGIPMKDWQAAARNWARRSEGGGKDAKTKLDFGAYNDAF